MTQRALHSSAELLSQVSLREVAASHAIGDQLVTAVSETWVVMSLLSVLWPQLEGIGAEKDVHQMLGKWWQVESVNFLHAFVQAPWTIGQQKVGMTAVPIDVAATPSKALGLRGFHRDALG